MAHLNPFSPIAAWHRWVVYCKRARCVFIYVFTCKILHKVTFPSLKKDLENKLVTWSSCTNRETFRPEFDRIFWYWSKDPYSTRNINERSYWNLACSTSIRYVDTQLDHPRSSEILELVFRLNTSLQKTQKKGPRLNNFEYSMVSVNDVCPRALSILGFCDVTVLYSGLECCMQDIFASMVQWSCMRASKTSKNWSKSWVN